LIIFPQIPPPLELSKLYETVTLFASAVASAVAIEDLEIDSITGEFKSNIHMKRYDIIQTFYTYIDRLDPHGNFDYNAININKFLSI